MNFVAFFEFDSGMWFDEIVKSSPHEFKALGDFIEKWVSKEQKIVFYKNLNHYGVDVVEEIMRSLMISMTGSATIQGAVEAFVCKFPHLSDRFIKLLKHGTFNARQATHIVAELSEDMYKHMNHSDYRGFLDRFFNKPKRFYDCDYDFVKFCICMDKIYMQAGRSMYMDPADL